MEQRLGRRPDSRTGEWDQERVIQRRVAPGKGNSAYARYADVTPVAQLQRKDNRGPVAAAIQRKGRAGKLLGGAEKVLDKVHGASKKLGDLHKDSFKLGGLSFDYGIKTEVAIKNKRVDGKLGEETSGAVSEAKVELLTRKIATAFIKGKTKVAGYEQLYLAVDGKLADASVSSDGLSLKIATVRLVLKGQAPELLTLADSKATVAVSGYVSITALDGSGALRKLEKLEKRVRECGERVDDRTKEIQKLKKKRRYLQAKEQRIRKRHSKVLERKRSRPRLDQQWRQQWRSRQDDTRHRLSKQFRRAGEQARAIDRKLAVLDKAYAGDMRALRKAEKSLARSVRSLHDKASRAFARGVAAFSKRFIGKVLLRALPVVGWIATIIEAPEAYRALEQLLKGNVGLGGEGGNDEQGSGGGDGGDGSGDKSGELGTGGDGGEDAGSGTDDGMSPAQRVRPDAIDAGKEDSIWEERATIDPDQASNGKTKAGPGQRENQHSDRSDGKRVTDGEVAVRPGRKMAGEDDATVKTGEESPADGEVAKRDDEEADVGGEGNEDVNERVAKPGEAIAEDGDETAGPGDQAAREGEEDGRVAKPGEAIARNDSEAAGEGEEVVKAGEEQEDEKSDDGDRQYAWDPAVDAPKEVNLIVEPAIIGAEDHQPGGGGKGRDGASNQGRNRLPPGGGNRRRGPVSGRHKSKSKTVFQVYQNEIDEIARLDGGKLLAADPATLTSWARAKQVEPGVLPDDATVRIRKVLVVQTGTGAGASAGIPCRITLVFEVQGLQSGPELRKESFNILYSPGGHQSLEKIAGPEAKLREALASGEKLVVMPDYELEIGEINEGGGWVRVLVIRSEPGCFLVDNTGKVQPAVEGSYVQLSHPGK